MFGRQRQAEAVAHVNRDIGDDLGAAGRDVEHGAFALGAAFAEADPGDAVAQLPPRLPLCPDFRVYHAHGHCPSVVRSARSVDPAGCGKTLKWGLAEWMQI